ncbi:hypothetical protein CC2G_008707 [Coprinopsis cinerea AmutBmut pab1-1]|nr:hypothetical protein CC2G_008707 [Coprinopsis cinerea AmutBmut pab1-1]
MKPVVGMYLSVSQGSRLKPQNSEDLSLLPRGASSPLKHLARMFSPHGMLEAKHGTEHSFKRRALLASHTFDATFSTKKMRACVLSSGSASCSTPFEPSPKISAPDKSRMGTCKPGIE